VRDLRWTQLKNTQRRRLPRCGGGKPPIVVDHYVTSAQNRGHDAAPSHTRNSSSFWAEPGSPDAPAPPVPVRAGAADAVAMPAGSRPIDSPCAASRPNPQPSGAGYPKRLVWLSSWSAKRTAPQTSLDEPILLDLHLCGEGRKTKNPLSRSLLGFFIFFEPDHQSIRTALDAAIGMTNRPMGRSVGWRGVIAGLPHFSHRAIAINGIVCLRQQFREVLNVIRQARFHRRGKHPISSIN